MIPAAVAVAALSLVLRAQEPQQPQQPTFRSGASTVAVYATVTDASGRLVPNLTREDFEVYDNGKLQPLTLFAAETQPISIAIMLDRSGSMRENNVLVLTADQPYPAPTQPGLPADINVATRHAQDVSQREVAQLVPGAEHITKTDSGHDIMLENPVLVSDSILDVIAAVRDGRSSLNGGSANGG